MKISIITATFNSASTVADTLESILSQTYQDYEVVIKDGLSRDGTVELVKSYEEKFGGRLRIISSKDKGIYDAMNIGISAATGDVIGILNSDDFYHDSGVLQDIAQAFEDSETDAVCGNLLFVDQFDARKVVRKWEGSPYRPFSKGWHPAHPTFYVRKSVLERCGLFDLSFDVSADFELMLRAIEKFGCRIKYIDRCFVMMREGGESTGSIKKIIVGNRNVLRAFKKNGIRVSAFYPVKRLAPKMVDKVKNKIGL